MGALGAERLVLALGRAAHDEARFPVELGPADRHVRGSAEGDGGGRRGVLGVPELGLGRAGGRPSPAAPASAAPFSTVRRAAGRPGMRTPRVSFEADRGGTPRSGSPDWRGATTAAAGAGDRTDDTGGEQGALRAGRSRGDGACRLRPAPAGKRPRGSRGGQAAGRPCRWRRPPVVLRGAAAIGEPGARGIRPWSAGRPLGLAGPGRLLGGSGLGAGRCAGGLRLGRRGLLGGCRLLHGSRLLAGAALRAAVLRGVPPEGTAASAIRSASRMDWRNFPVWLAGTEATCSGVPSATDQSAAVAALGAHVDHPVGGLDDVEVVLDDDHRVALVHEAREHRDQLADVLEVQTGGRLVQDVDRTAGGALLSSLASLTRCASPPERVGADCPSRT